MCMTRHTLEPFLKLKTVLDKSASSLSLSQLIAMFPHRWCGVAVVPKGAQTLLR